MVPSSWLIPEWIRSYQGLGGPWGLYGASQWQHPAVLALAAVGGVWLVSVALLIANAGLMLLLGAIRPALLAPAASRTGGRPAVGPARRPAAPAAAGRCAAPRSRRPASAPSSSRPARARSRSR